MILSFAEFLKAAERNGLTVGLAAHGTMPSVCVRTRSSTFRISPVYVGGGCDAVDWTATLCRVRDFTWPRKVGCIQSDDTRQLVMDVQVPRSLLVERATP